MFDRLAVRRGSRLKVDNYPGVPGAFGRLGLWHPCTSVGAAGHGGPGVVLFRALAAVADPVGQIGEFSTGTNTALGPQSIPPEPYEDLWFTDFLASTIGRITPGPARAPAPTAACPTAASAISP